MNKKGFALTETLVVVVFLVTIFTFVYVSIIPLIGEYENMLDVEKDIDNIYKLSRIRSIIMSDANRNEVTSLPVNKIECSDLGYATFCEKVLEQLELITDEEQTRIEDGAHPIIFGDELVDFLNSFLDIFERHSHPWAQDAPALSKADKETLHKTPLKEMLSKAIKIN